VINATTLPATSTALPVIEQFRAPSWALRREAGDDQLQSPRRGRSDVRSKGDTASPSAAPKPVAPKTRRERRADMEKLEDLDLLHTVVQGDDLAWAVFYDRFRNLMIACVSRVCLRSGVRLQADDLSDILGEACMNMVSHDFRRLRLYKIDGGCSVSSWIGVIATSTAHDHLRRERRRRLDPMLDSDLERVAPPVEGPDCTLMDRQQRTFVDQALIKFSARDKRFVELYFVEAMPPEAIADEMGVSVSTVYSKKAKIKSRLKRLAKTAA
jgi:RNA polymerase sigma-70 factor, ECF subfamily